VQIIKANETMTARQRVIKTFAYEKTDRVPINYGANPTIHKKITAALGCANNNEALLQTLGVDFRSGWIAYKGSLIYKEIPGLSVDPVYGYYTRWVENEFGGYQDFCHFPLQNKNDEEINAFIFPSPDDFGFTEAVDRINHCGDYAVFCGNPGIGDIINSIGRLMGMEDTLVGIASEDEAVLSLIDRKLNMELGMLERLLNYAKGRIDFMWIGEDLGTQHAPMISPALYRSVLRPRHQRFVDLGKSYNIPVMVHSCGSSSWVYEDFIEMGVTAVDTLQPEAANMSPQYLVEQFGKRLSFHGCISTAGSLAYGKANEVTRYCESIMEIMKPNGGYHFASTHLIQDNTPVENVIAMYQAAHTYGVY
jgi:hypothetical protein